MLMEIKPRRRFYACSPDYFRASAFGSCLNWDEIRLQHMGYNIFYIIGVIVVIAVILKFLGLY
jgi:hypothetical protein